MSHRRRMREHSSLYNLNAERRKKGEAAEGNKRLSIDYVHRQHSKTKRDYVKIDG